jgi:hypothetical protein
MHKFESFRNSEVWNLFRPDLLAQVPTIITLERTDIASTSSSMDLSVSYPNFLIADGSVVSILSICRCYSYSE